MRNMPGIAPGKPSGAGLASGTGIRKLSCSIGSPMGEGDRRSDVELEKDSVRGDIMSGFVTATGEL